MSCLCAQFSWRAFQQFTACAGALEMENKMSRGKDAQVQEEKDRLAAQVQELEVSLRKREGW